MYNGLLYDGVAMAQSADIICGPGKAVNALFGKGVNGECYGKAK
jgi:hypothetical protein